jgi:hypothetical protein
MPSQPKEKENPQENSAFLSWYWAILFIHDSKIFACKYLTIRKFHVQIIHGGAAGRTHILEHALSIFMSRRS